MIGFGFFGKWGGCCVAGSLKVNVPWIVGIVRGVEAFCSVAFKLEEFEKLMCMVE